MSRDAGFVVAPAPPVSIPVVGTAERFPVRRIYCVGRNYVAHIREMKEADERDPPFFFQKPADAIVPDGATIPYPADTADFQYEIELVAAIGRGGRNIREEDAPGHVYGYAVGIDLTRRDRQRDARDRQLPWEMGKSFDRSAPCGPIHPAGSPARAIDGAISLSVNGTEHQRGLIGEMIWSVPEVIAKLSESYALEPGDLIFTGTPAGVGPLVPGDVVQGAIDGLGTLTLFIGPKED